MGKGTAKLPNAPSTTGKPSGSGRGNNPPRPKSGRSNHSNNPSKPNPGGKGK